MQSYTQRTLAWLKSQDMRCGIAEKWCHYTKQRKDLFGFIDIVAMDPGNQRLIGVQSTGPNGHASHIRKILSEDHRDDALMWLLSGGSLWLVSWRQLKVKNKDGKYGKRKRWEPRVHEFSLSDFLPNQ